MGRLQRFKSLLRRIREVGPAGVARLGEAFVMLVTAKLMLNWLASARVIAWKQRPLPAEVAPDDESLQKVRHAVLVVSRYSPWRFVCFPQCLAASEMLRRRGISSQLHYGVTRQNDELITHTWLEAGGHIVIGGEVAAQYSTLAVY